MTAQGRGERALPGAAAPPGAAAQPARQAGAASAARLRCLGMDPQPLAGRTIAVPETRELEVFAAMLERRARVRRITRGPKPARALRELGLKPDLPAPTPTTAGVIAALGGLDLKGRRVGVQLYGTEPNTPLVEFLERAGATVRCVAPYVYA